MSEQELAQAKKNLLSERGDIKRVSKIAKASYTTIFNWVNGKNKNPPKKEREIIEAIRQLKEEKQQQRKENLELLEEVINL